VSSSGTASTSGSSSTGGARFSCNLGDGGLFGVAIGVQTGLALLPNYYYYSQHPMDVGDINGDGNLDIVIADQGSGDVAVLFGNGDGTFAQAVHSQVPAALPYPYDDALGPIDVHIATMGSPPGPFVVMWNSEVAAILVESVQPTGDLNLVAILDAGYPEPEGKVQVADFNGDGIADCIGEQIGGLTVFLGNDVGEYTRAGAYSVGWCGESCTGDFNEDGIPDLFVMSTQPGLDFSVALGLGDGTFSSTLIHSGITGNFSLEVWRIGDLNGDGHLDVVIQDQTGSSNNIVLLGRGDGTFTQAATPTFVPDHLVEALRDMNGDGHLDYVGTGGEVALGNGDGTFNLPIGLYPYSNVWKVVVADVNNDGRPDLVASYPGTGYVSVFLNNCR
jgi:hypothetical protein